MKKILASAAIVALIASASTTPAFAGSEKSNASACGAAHGAFADQNGNFGWLGGVGGTPGYHGGATGQDPGATGYNNSHVDCHGGDPEDPPGGN